MLWHVTRAFPVVTDGAGKLIKHKRPDTFAAIMSTSDIDKSTLGKSNRYADPNEHIFYSRKWAERGARRQQTGSIGFDYPLTAVETQSVTIYAKHKKRGTFGVRFSLLVMDQHPSKGDPRTVEQLEADLTAMFDQTIREWVGNWGAYKLADGTVQWSPMAIVDARPVKMISDCLSTDGIEGRYFHDAGVDQVAAVQGFISLELPRLDCYLPAGEGGPVAFDYGFSTDSPRRPDGLLGNSDEQETPTT